MPKVDLDSIEGTTGSAMPLGLDRLMAGRTQYALGAAAGLTQFGANLVELAPGAASALRHWHVHQDEFLVVLGGELTLIEDDGPVTLKPGDCAAFPAGVPNGHHLVNQSDTPGYFVVIGTHTETEVGFYPDHNLRIDIDEQDTFTFTQADGSPLDA